ncbi:hypothetical protein BD779DRAFT_1625487 [Infundibulicybe gibba]|nr:hypothetical protein BD779DRAFT_1625487 [Infundibulicybe gibba]
MENNCDARDISNQHLDGGLHQYESQMMIGETHAGYCMLPTPPEMETLPTLYFAWLPTPYQSKPPHIDEGDVEKILVSISTSFHPGADGHPPGPDLIFSSSDSVLFYVHSHIIRAVSKSAFQPALIAPRSSDKCENSVVNVPEPSVTLNVILHMLYGKSCAQHSPSLEILLTALRHMPHHGIDPKIHITTGTPLFDLFLSFAPLFPLELYAAASQFDLYDVAASTSSYLLLFPLSTITDEMAEQIDAIYLKRLMFLHINRFQALKSSLLAPPHPHPATWNCDLVEQKKLTRVWAMVSAYLVRDAQLDLSTHNLQTALNPFTEQLSCPLCLESLENRAKDIIVQWASIKVRTSASSMPYVQITTWSTI